MGTRALFSVGCPVIVMVPKYPERFVLVQEPKKGNSYNLPGGGLDEEQRDKLHLGKRTKPEHPFTCAIREVEEESGLKVHLLGALATLDMVRSERDPKIHLTFVAKAIGGAFRETEQHPSIILATLEEMRALDENQMLRSDRVIGNVSQYLEQGIGIALKDIKVCDSDPYPQIIDLA